MAWVPLRHEKPRLHHGFVWPEELEPRLQGILLVQVFSVANMAVDIRLELRFDVREHHFPDGKVDRDVVLTPDGPLGANGTVRTTANQKPPVSGSSHHVHGQDSRWVSDLQGAVDVKTDQDDQVSSSGLWVGWTSFSPVPGFS